MNKQILTTLLLVAASLQVACGKDKKDKAMDAFTQQCNTQACIDMYTNAAKNAGIAGIPAVAGKPQIATPGAPVLPGQVPETSILPASVSNAQIASQQAAIKSALQQINSTTPASTTATNVAPASTGNMSVASVPANVSIDVARLPASDPTAEAPQTHAMAPASFDNGSSVAADVEASGVGAGR